VFFVKNFVLFVLKERRSLPKAKSEQPKAILPDTSYPIPILKAKDIRHLDLKN